MNRDVPRPSLVGDVEVNLSTDKKKKKKKVTTFMILSTAVIRGE